MMDWMKRCSLLLLLAQSFVSMAGEVMVTSVTAQQRYPWNGLVDIVVTIDGDRNTIAQTECSFAATNSATQVAVSVAAVNKVGTDSFSGNVCTRRYLWEAARDVGAVKINDLVLVVEVKPIGVQLWDGGPYWAECNLGASKPEEYGYYFWWGDTVGYKRNAGNSRWLSVKSSYDFSFTSGRCSTHGMNNSQLLSAGYIDSTGNLVAGHDAATKRLGAPWRMPTSAEVEALIYNCDNTLTTRGGVSGRLFTGRGAHASKSIFLPFAGYGCESDLESAGSFGGYWSSTPKSDGTSYYALRLGIASGSVGRVKGTRAHGHSVRPLQEFTTNAGTMTTRLKLDCRTDARVCSARGMDFCYDANWYKKGEEVRISDNGVIVHTGVAGFYTWKPVSAGLHTLKMEVLAGGKVIATEMARFAHVYIKAIAVQQRYPWNGLVDVVVTIEGGTNAIVELVCAFSATNVVTQAAVNITTISQVGPDEFSDNVCTRYFIWNAVADVGAVKIDDISLTVDIMDAVGGVQLWENGPYWAECNVGAMNPNEGGYYFWWGDTAGCKRNIANDGWLLVKNGSSFSFSPENCPTYGMSNSQLLSAGYIDSTGNLVSAYDTVTTHLGAPWRMPTDEDFTALINNCNTTWTTLGGVYGRLVTGRGAYASKSIFLPAAGYGAVYSLYYTSSGGYYWSSTPKSDSSNYARSLSFGSSDIDQDYMTVYFGEFIRPLRGFSEVAGSASMIGVGVTTVLALDCKGGVRVCAADGEVLCYDASWYENGDEVRISDNGVVIHTGVAGSYTWKPVSAGPHTLKVEALSSGQVIATETAQFVAYDEDGFAIMHNRVVDYCYRDQTAVVVPDEIIGIDQGVFSDMYDLVAVSFPSTLQRIGDWSFANDYCLDNVVIPDAVELIGDGAFSNCTEVASITFGNSLKNVGDDAFYNCISLESIVFQEGLTNLGERAFAGPSRLKSVSLPASLGSIGQDAFRGSAYITGVTVPTHLATMRELFPDSYQKIESVVVPEGEGVIIDSMFDGCKALTSIVIPSTVTNIGELAFANCVALAELGLPDEVTTLGAYAFYRCQNLKTVSLPRQLTAIGDETFSGCAQLDSLVIPAEVKTLGAQIYSGLWESPYTTKLTGVYFLGDAPATQDDTYQGMPNTLISYVVKGSKGWYVAGSPTLPPSGWPTIGNTRPITYWTPNEFEVTFDGNGGSPATYVVKQITDTTYSLPKSYPTRTSYLFDGWWTEKTAGAQVHWNSRVTAKKAHTLYAHWRALSDGITVIFNPNGGMVDPDEVTYPAGVTYGDMPVPTRIGHRFDGWYTSQTGGDLVDEATVVSKVNNELYAHWTPITYSVVYNANGGLGTMSAQTHTYNVSQALTANAYYLNGFKFTGWSETAGGSVKYANNAVVENLAEVQGQVVTLYAVWNGASYAVRFDGNGGSGIMENQAHTVSVRQPLSKCVFTRTGYAFIGWATTSSGVVEYEDEEEVQNLTMQGGNTVSLYAVWSPIQYSIVYNANGGTGSMPTQTAIYDRESDIAACGYARSGFAFVGWSDEEDGEVVYTPGDKVLNLSNLSGGVVNLYAIWGQQSVAAPVFSPVDGTVFADSCQVTISCPTAGADVYYRVGATPKASSKYLYSAAFSISDTSTIYAFAKLGSMTSEVVTATLTKGVVETFETAVGAVGITSFMHGGDATWFIDKSVGAHSGGSCVRSGSIGDEQMSWFEAVVEGPGTISFYWKTSCEDDEEDDWDHLVFWIDSSENEIGRLDGDANWQKMSVEVGSGKHTLHWAYVKDESDLDGEDCGRVDDIVWSPSAAQEDPIPDIGDSPSAADVAAVVADAADEKVAANIDETNYNDFRDWAGNVKAVDGNVAAGAAGVMASETAWLSYALGQGALLGEAPTDEDLSVETFTPSTKSGKFDFTVSVKDIEVSSEATKENLKKVFGLEGAATLDDAAFSSDKVDIEFATPVDGNVKFTAGPKDADAKAFFMKVKLNP